jgi:indole-3-glycerol phosphate synthase
MMILDEIAAYTRIRVDNEKACIPLEVLRERCTHVLNSKTSHIFESALKKPGLSFICEIKQASPSRGMIVTEFPYQDIAQDYERAGTDAISCLTEPHWFKGSDDIFAEIRALVDVPMLRKDFTLDVYQIYQAKLMGADAVLLICALLDAATVERFLMLCEELNLDALVEAHDEREIAAALSAGACIIGVNNRNLKDFSVDLGNSDRLRSLIPHDRIFVAESGVSKPSDVEHLAAIGVDAVLMGEMMMRTPDRTEMLRSLRRCTQ